MSNLSLPDERELLIKVAAGNGAAYTVFFNTYSQRVFEVAMLYLKDEIAARETVQEIFLKIWVKRAVMATVEDFPNYLFILTRNHIYDSFKKQLVKQKAIAYLHAQEPEHIADTDHRLQEHQYEALLHTAISALPPGRKKIYMARQQGFSNEEISRQLNISVHTVKKQLQLATRFLRTFIRRQLQSWLLTLLLLFSFRG
ncbi:RNA polymerase sigma factor [Chitinophaga nivalis]|uniref:Sigma-70 family RNA polymerase sigma factor n=1 Tax=Chitinophaga nivalis TaxID=2991709 RepID=A0ABT3IGR1_9BACT|nr:sigma-70 family RNA polymerase sigma factor [Chitinophaga nivalis]MCW3467150.1 sigma-70 family RNA polymerase sigma factor [Chitinophaga nivalis]MCW3483158.1 sigma-70 family RNA polymerase sigma factor [Chitinophaga nivalis]